MCWCLWGDSPGSYNLHENCVAQTAVSTSFSCASFATESYFILSDMKMTCHTSFFLLRKKKKKECSSLYGWLYFLHSRLRENLKHIFVRYLHEKLFAACTQPPLSYACWKHPPLSTQQKFKNRSQCTEPDVISAVFISCSLVAYDSWAVCTAQVCTGWEYTERNAMFGKMQRG